jgi:hypothetical protein
MEKMRIWDPGKKKKFGSGIRDGKKIRIRDKYPGPQHYAELSILGESYFFVKMYYITVIVVQRGF